MTAALSWGRQSASQLMGRNSRNRALLERGSQRLRRDTVPNCVHRCAPLYTTVRTVSEAAAGFERRCGCCCCTNGAGAPPRDGCNEAGQGTGNKAREWTSPLQVSRVNQEEKGSWAGHQRPCAPAPMTSHRPWRGQKYEVFAAKLPLFFPLLPGFAGIPRGDGPAASQPSTIRPQLDSKTPGSSGSVA